MGILDYNISSLRTRFQRSTGTWLKRISPFSLRGFPRNELEIGRINGNDESRSGNCQIDPDTVC